MLFFLYAIEIINEREYSPPNYGFGVDGRINVVRRCATEPLKWRRVVPEAPNRHFARTMGLNVLPSINRLVYAIRRENAVIPLGNRR
jgi:hypothetical protein